MSIMIFFFKKICCNRNYWLLLQSMWFCRWSSWYCYRIWAILCIALAAKFITNQNCVTMKPKLLEKNVLTSISSAAISINSLSTFSASLAEVSKKYIPCLCAKSSPTWVGISRSSLSILFPTSILSTLLLAYSSISLSQSGKQSNVGWQDIS